MFPCEQLVNDKKCCFGQFVQSKFNYFCRESVTLFFTDVAFPNRQLPKEDLI